MDGEELRHAAGGFKRRAPQSVVVLEPGGGAAK